jgi:hypothetical protein
MEKKNRVIRGFSFLSFTSCAAVSPAPLDVERLAFDVER